PLLKPEELTAVAGGNPGWAASFDTAEERFAHYDDLADVTGSVSYLVSGWYSDVALDPCADAHTLQRFTDIIDSLGWVVDKDQLKVAQQAVQNRIKKTPSVLNIGSKRIRSRAGANVGVVRSSDLLSGAGRSNANIADFIKDKSVTQPYWPQQSVFHGVLYEVKLTQNRQDNRPPANRVDIAVGQTSPESLSALIATASPVSQRSAAERLHLSFQYQMVDIIDDADGLPRLDEEFHKRTFETQHGGYIKERVKTGDPFAHLRPPKKPGDFLGPNVSVNPDYNYKGAGALKDMTHLKAHHTYFAEEVSPSVSNKGFIAADAARPRPARSFSSGANGPQNTTPINTPFVSPG
ncbi:MAG: hypothetical protein KAG66_18195, partial [Methylococcales bacterium]|nr:hypothetical protein [Methylococcales bacterium]